MKITLKVYISCPLLVVLLAHDYQFLCSCIFRNLRTSSRFGALGQRRPILEMCESLNRGLFINYDASSVDMNFNTRLIIRAQFSTSNVSRVDKTLRSEVANMLIFDAKLIFDQYVFSNPLTSTIIDYRIWSIHRFHNIDHGSSTEPSRSIEDDMMHDSVDERN